MRLGKLEAKLGLVTMLRKFSYQLNENDSHTGDMQFDPRHFLLQPRNNIYLRVSRR